MTEPAAIPRRPVILVILDGFGINPSKINNAVAQARTPRLHEYFFRYSFSVLNEVLGVLGIRAVEALDREAGRVLDAAVAHGYSAILTADHGNCDLMVDPETDEPHTQHSTHPVPFLVVDESRWTLAPAGSLADVAPSVLTLMGIPAPAEMSGRSMLIQPLPPQAVPALERLDAA